jgi:hypothetical protein
MIAAKKAHVHLTWRTEGQQYRVWRITEVDLPSKPKRLWVRETKKQVPFPEAPKPVLPNQPEGEDLSLL